MPLLTILHRSLRLRCPRCGRGKVFSGWFRMHSRCSQCELLFDREPGYFLGSIYFNYGLTATIVILAGTVGYLLGVQHQLLPIGLMVFCLAFPLWFFRYARCLWMGFDELFDPRQPQRSAAIQILDQAIRREEPEANDGPGSQPGQPSKSDAQ
jgi:uncharacterized protein (DUF983 family)